MPAPPAPPRDQHDLAVPLLGQLLEIDFGGGASHRVGQTELAGLGAGREHQEAAFLESDNGRQRTPCQTLRRGVGDPARLQLQTFCGRNEVRGLGHPSGQPQFVAELPRIGGDAEIARHQRHGIQARVDLFDRRRSVVIADC
ncbi:hypothetical protein ACVMB0_006647 [Bradyrhizobium sp. USDA 4451]